MPCFFLLVLTFMLCYNGKLRLEIGGERTTLCKKNSESVLSLSFCFILWSIPLSKRHVIGFKVGANQSLFDKHHPIHFFATFWRRFKCAFELYNDMHKRWASQCVTLHILVCYRFAGRRNAGRGWARQEANLQLIIVWALPPPWLTSSQGFYLCELHELASNKSWKDEKHSIGATNHYLDQICIRSAFIMLISEMCGASRTGIRSCGFYSFHLLAIVSWNLCGFHLVILSFPYFLPFLLYRNTRLHLHSWSADTHSWKLSLGVVLSKTSLVS